MAQLIFANICLFSLWGIDKNVGHDDSAFVRRHTYRPICTQIAHQWRKDGIVDPFITGMLRVHQVISGRLKEEKSLFAHKEARMTWNSPVLSAHAQLTDHGFRRLLVTALSGCRSSFLFFRTGTIGYTCLAIHWPWWWLRHVVTHGSHWRKCFVSGITYIFSRKKRNHWQVLRCAFEYR